MITHFITFKTSTNETRIYEYNSPSLLPEGIHLKIKLHQTETTTIYELKIDKVTYGVDAEDCTCECTVVNKVVTSNLETLTQAFTE